MFARIPNLLTAEQVATCSAALLDAQTPWVDGRATAGYQGAQVKHNLQLEEGSPLARELGGVIVKELERSATFISAVLPNKVYPPVFNRFDEGMQFGTHVDGSVRTIPGTAQKLRTDLSATLFLTSPEAYDGGELVMESDFGNQRAKLGPGDLIVYSAAMRHRVNAVTRGTRLAAVIWIESLVREDHHREQLFELDRSIQLLTQRQGDAECIVRLTAHYHSLVQQWTTL